MWRVKTFTRVSALVYILSVSASGVWAQESAQHASGTGSATSLATGALVSSTVAYDIIFGANTRGPYALSWKPIDRYSERVLVDNRPMLRVLDYDIDYASGLIAFAERLSSQRVARVEYSYDPTKAVQNGKAVAFPLTLDLVKKENTDLRFLGLYKQADANVGSSSDVAVYGLAGAAGSKTGSLSSMLLYSPEMAGGNGLDGGSFGDRSALQLGGSAKSDALQLSTSYVHVGEQFVGAQDYKLQRGLDAFNIAAVLKLNSELSVSTAVKRSEVSLGDGQGKMDTVVGHSLTFAGDSGPKVTLSRTETEKQRPGAVDQTVRTDKLQLEHKAGSNLSAVATHEAVTTAAGKESNLGLGITAAPSRGLTVSAAVDRSSSDRAGETDAESISLVAKPGRSLDLRMDVAHKDVERSGDESSRMLRLSTTALRNARVELAWTDTESEVGGPEEFRGLRLETSPVASVKLFGALGQKETPGSREISREARVEVSPLSHTKLGGGIKETESNGAVLSRVTEVSASTKPAESVEVSGAYKAREALKEDDLDSLNLALLLDTGRLLRLTGAYASNPEDKKGVVERLNSQSIGLDSDLGRLKLKSAYTLRHEYLAGRRSEGIELGVDYWLSSDSLLSTKYSASEYREASALGTEIYTLGYTHRIGSRLDLYLGGRMTCEEDRAALGDQREYQAEARLGIRF